LLYLNDYRYFSRNLNLLPHPIRQLGEVCLPFTYILKPNIENLFKLIHVPSIAEVNTIERLSGVTVPVTKFIEAGHNICPYHS